MCQDLSATPKRTTFTQTRYKLCHNYNNLVNSDRYVEEKARIPNIVILLYFFNFTESYPKSGKPIQPVGVKVNRSNTQV